MDAYDYDYQTDRPEMEFPLARTDYRRLYLDARNGSMQPSPVEEASSVGYDGQTGQVAFDVPFAEDTEITGYSYLDLFVEADGHDDMR